MKLRSKKGRLTAYALSCGYIEKRDSRVLGMEHGVYRIYNGSQWTYTRTLTEARKLFDKF